MWDYSELLGMLSHTNGARDALIGANMGRIRGVARRILRSMPLPPSITAEDLIAVGYEALTEAAEKADPDRLDSFPAYAAICAAGRIRNWIAGELRHANASARDPADERAVDLPDERADFMAQVECEEAMQTLQRASGAEAKVIEMRRAGRSLRETAHALGTNHVRVLRMERRATARVRALIAAA